MKLRLRKAQGALAARVQCQVVFTNPITELWPFIIGRFVLYGEDPQLVFTNLKLSNAPAILEFWFRSGLILGTPSRWSLSPNVKAKLKQVQKPPTAVSATHSLRHLVVTYHNLRKRKPGQVADKNFRNRSNLIRMLSLAYPGVDLEAKMREFFTRLSNDYSLDSFVRYVVASVPEKPKRYGKFLLLPP